MLRQFVRFCICFSIPLSFAADKPALEHLFPAGGPRGTTNDVTFFGKFDSWPPKAWASVPGVDFLFTTNKGKAQIAVPSNAPVGPCLLRLFNDEGPSDLRIFVVSDKAELLEKEPNNHFAKAQQLTNLPVTVNGRLEKNGDVDSFSFSIRAGEWIDARLDSYTLLAKLDPVLRLVTTNGYQLDWNHDFASLDPRLVWQAPYDLTAVVQVFGFVYPADSDIRLSGGSSGVYRLHLSTESSAPADVSEPLTEREPNNETNTARSVEIPAEVIGLISPSQDVDRFKAMLKKDQTVELSVRAASIGSVLDGWVAVENAAGKELARNDDADNSRDPKLEWTAPEDGAYYFAVGSTTHQGTPNCRYHFLARTLAPDYRISSPVDSITLSTGTTNTLKLNLKRWRGFTNELVATIKDLPPGVQVDPVTLPAKDGDISLPFVVSTNAVPTNSPFAITVTDKQTSAERLVPFDLVSRSENNGVPGGYSTLLVESADRLWLTVKTNQSK